MFYDQAKVFLKAGDGGNGVVAFRREKHVAHGGPSGGDGGHGGSIYLVGDQGLRTLVDFRYRPHYKGARGEHGQGKNRHGKDSPDLKIRVPLGTVVKNHDTGAVIADIIQEGQEVLVAKGGRGGRGNARFVSPLNRIPKVAENGEPGKQLTLELELKVLADVGLVGLPNAGKSTLIASITSARPKIADYPFTTITPNLGVVSLGDGNSFVVADIPGLIEGAHQGVGLGLEFLKHIERTRIFVHVLDLLPENGKDVIENFEVVNNEMGLYDSKLTQKVQIVAANKMDLTGAADSLKSLQKGLKDRVEVFPISAATGSGLKALVDRLSVLLNEIEPETLYPLLDYEVLEETPSRFSIKLEDGRYVVTGKEIEKHFAMTDFNNEDAVERFQRILKTMGVEEALKQHGIQYGDTVQICNMEFEFAE